MLDDGRLVGLAGSVFFPRFLNANHLAGQELFMWGEPEERERGELALRAALEQWAREKGVKSYMVIAPQHPNRAVMARVYRRAGYAPHGGVGQSGIR